MTTAYWCVLCAALLPILWAGVAKVGGGHYNNAHPRQYLAALTGWPARAHSAQQNSHEALPAFAAAVIIAQLCHGSQATVDALALTFIALRVLYGLCYISDLAALRSLIWLAGYGCVVGLFITAAG